MKKFVVIFIIVLCLGSFFINSYGMDAVVNLDSSKKVVHPYEEMFVSINIQSLAGFDTSVGAMECFLNYDKNVFEKVTKNSIAMYNLNSNFSYDERTNKLIIFKENFKNDKCVVKIKFKAKANIATTATDIKVTDLKIFDGNNKFFTSSAKLDVDLEKAIVTSGVSSSQIKNPSAIVDSTENDLIFSADKYSNIVQNLQKNMPFVNSNNKFSVMNILTQPLYLILIFVFGYLGIILFNFIIKVIIESLQVQKEIFRSRRTNWRLRKVFSKLDNY